MTRGARFGGFALYPLLAAVYAAVRVAAGNAFDVRLGELAAMVSVCALVALAIVALVFTILRRRVAAPAIALVALLAIAWLFNVEPLADSGPRATSTAPRERRASARSSFRSSRRRSSSAGVSRSAAR